MKTYFSSVLLILGCCFLSVTLTQAQDSSIKYIMPYECDRLFPEQIMEYQAYYNNELAINKLSIADILQQIADLKEERQSRKVKFARWALEDDLELQEKLKTDLDFYLSVWLEIEEFYDQRRTLDFLANYDATQCYTLYTLYDTLQVGAKEITLREKEKEGWMEYPEATDAEYIEDVRVITPASSRWEKKKSDRPCNSPDPNDCLVWCLIEIPAEVEVLSRELNIIECPVSYKKSQDGLRCEKMVKFTGDLMIAESENAVYINELKREVEVLDWEVMGCQGLKD